jgi:hypothetical protein
MEGLPFYEQRTAEGARVFVLGATVNRPLTKDIFPEYIDHVIYVGIRIPQTAKAILERASPLPCIRYDYLFQNGWETVALWKIDWTGREQEIFTHARTVIYALATNAETAIAEKFGGKRLHFQAPVPRDGKYRTDKGAATPEALVSMKISAPIIANNAPDIASQAAALIGALAEYEFDGTVVGADTGPVITLFRVQPAPKTRLSQIERAAPDIARALNVKSLRLTSPGNKLIGFELPNLKREDVLLRELLASDAYKNSRAALPLVLGKSTTGETTILDLAEMPHLLVAGATGSGKSVEVNAMIVSLLHRFTPGQINFMMLDPKMVELSVYSGIPHLVAPPITRPAKAIIALRWAIDEMMRRTELLSQVGVRNISGYNAKVKDKLPRLVIVVDEAANLMLTVGKEFEPALQDLAQMGRAVGVHIILATQRPSVDVIKGAIKANFISRIALKVLSAMDSKVILDDTGAEQLLGKGDMLYTMAGGPITRCHGAFVSDAEVETLCDRLRKTPPRYNDDLMAALAGEGDALACSDGVSPKRTASYVSRDPVTTFTLWLQTRLAEGPLTRSQIVKLAASEEPPIPCSGSTMEKAKNALGVIVEDSGRRDVSNLWRLPEGGEEA